MDCPSAVPDEGTEGGGNGEGDAEGKVERSRGLPASMLNIRRKNEKMPKKSARNRQNV